MSNAPLLVTGATGATGRYTIASLLESGTSVRAMVHRRDERSEHLQSLGVAVVVGDFADPDSIKLALRGVRGASFCYPIDHGIVEATALFAYAAKQAGVGVVVNMSQIIAREDAKSHASFHHWLAERVFDWSGVPVVHLRPGFFMEWLLAFAPMVQQGTIYAPFDQGTGAFISAEDQGRVIAAILQNPKAHIGKTYRLFGPKEYTFAEAAHAVGAALGRSVNYQKVPYEMMVEGIISRSKGTSRNDALSGYAESHAKKGNGNEAPVVQHLREALEDHNHGLFAGMGDEVERITGKPPMRIEEFVRKHIGPEVPKHAPKPAPPVQWGDPNVIRARLGDAVTDLQFARSEMLVPALSPQHVLASMQMNFGPLQKLMGALDQNDPAKSGRPSRRTASPHLGEFPEESNAPVISHDAGQEADVMRKLLSS